MNCPDCKGQVKLELLSRITGVDYEEIDSEPFYFCPKCKSNYDPEDLEE